MREEAYALYVGVDWGSEAHQVAIVDAARSPGVQQRVPHTGAALSQLADDLIQRTGGAPAQVAVAIEVPRGPVVETLLERGLHVYALNPKQLDRFRDRYSVAGAKDDRRDAQVLAEALRTDRAAFRRLQLDDPAVIRLRELTRLAAELHEEQGRLANRLREQLQRFYPQLLAVCPAADEPWLWALVDLAPTPAAARRLSQAQLARLLRTHRIRRLTAETLRAHLQTPALRVAPGTTEAISEHLALLVPRLRLVHTQHRACEHRLEALLAELAEPAPGQPAEHRDVRILRSLPGVGRGVAATMLAEAAALVAARDYHGLRTHTGVAPVTRQSGKSWEVAMRYACNERLRNAVYHWGRTSVQCDAHSRAHYATLRQRGHSHARALRGVVDRLLRVLIVMLQTRTLYDPARRRPLEQTA
jgi:transposase